MKRQTRRVSTATIDGAAAMGLDTVTADIGIVMNWLFPRLRDSQERSSAKPRSRDEGLPPPDPYHGAALGVECAWPLATDRELTRPLP